MEKKKKPSINAELYYFTETLPFYFLFLHQSQCLMRAGRTVPQCALSDFNNHGVCSVKREREREMERGRENHNYHG